MWTITAGVRITSNPHDYIDIHVIIQLDTHFHVVLDTHVCTYVCACVYV